MSTKVKITSNNAQGQSDKDSKHCLLDFPSSMHSLAAVSDSCTADKKTGQSGGVYAPSQPLE